MSDQVFMFQGVEEQLTETVVNPYSGQTVSLDGIYNVNTGTYNGQGTGNSLLMTNNSDAMFVLDSNSQPTISDIQRIVTGNGNDFLDLASSQVALGDLTIFGGNGNETIWDNSGNDTINTGTGNNNIVGGPGNDIINGNVGNDTVYIGKGNNTVNGGGGNDELVYNLPQNLGATDIFNGGTGTDTLTIQLTAAQANAYASEITGALAFVANNANAGSSTGPSYTFASLGLTISNVEIINIVITANTNPVAHEDDFTGQQGKAVHGNLLANNGHGAASDADGDTVTAVAGTQTTAHGGTVAINADGTFTYTPTSSFYGTDTFTYTVADGRGGTATATAVISVNGQPVAQEDDFAGQQGKAVTGNLLANNGHGAASDTDGDALSAVAGTLTSAHGGTAVVNADGTFTYTPTSSFYGTDTFSYTVADARGGTSTATAVISVNGQPVAQEDDFTTIRSQTVTGNVLANNGHGVASDPEGDPLTVAAAVITTAAGGQVTVSADGTFTYTGASGYTGADSFTYTVQDNHGGTATGTVDLTINPPPKVAPVAQEDDFVTPQGHSVTGNVLSDNGHGADSDPNGDGLSVLAATVTTAAGGHVNINADGTFSYTPAIGYSGADTFTYTLANSDGLQSSGTVDLTVAPLTSHPHEFSSSNVLFPAVIEGVNIAYLVPPGTPALGILHGELDIGNATQATVTFEQSTASYSNTLGSFVIAADGTIEDANIVIANAHQPAAGQQFDINLPAGSGDQLGFFIIADGYTANHSLSGINLSTGTLNFYYDYGHADQRLANVSDNGNDISLVYTDSHNHNTVLQGTDYFTTERGGSDALNPDDATHVVSGLSSASDTSDLRLSFEDLPNTGDADYNDVVFSVSMNSTTNTTTDAHGDTALVGSAGLFGSTPDKFMIDAVTPEPEKIVDFKTGGSGDALDISNILEGYNSLSSLFGSFVQATTSNGDTTIAVNADGHAGGAFTAVAVLEGVSASLAQLVTDGNLLATHSS